MLSSAEMVWFLSTTWQAGGMLTLVVDLSLSGKCDPLAHKIWVVKGCGDTTKWSVAESW